MSFILNKNKGAELKEIKKINKKNSWLNFKKKLKIYIINEALHSIIQTLKVVHLKALISVYI